MVTDLTKMPGPSEVCIVGVSQRDRCVRPILPSGTHWKHLYSGDKLVIRPRAKVTFEFHKVPIKPPHIEDFGFDPNSIVYHGLCTDAEWEEVLRVSSFSTVDDIYDGFLQEQRWVEPGANTRSIGTLSKVHITTVQLPMWEGKLKYRLSFRDITGSLFNCPVSDLAFRELCYKEVKGDNFDRLEVSKELTNLLKDADRVYLRLGLARPWSKSEEDELRCYLQVTGIHTFPDYLEGKAFADFQRPF